jgi:hypothetical protein
VTPPLRESARRVDAVSDAGPLRLVVFDATQLSRPPRALGASWHAGALLYKSMRYVDAVYGARTVTDALDWAVRTAKHRPIAELQYWGHGKWGRILVDRESLDRGALLPSHALRPKLDALRERLSPNALIWFRTCETLGACPGQNFAAALADFTGASIAGHTYVIGYFQSGLHQLAPGTSPTWSKEEGLADGSAEEPRSALRSGPLEPNTITCFTHRVPASLD